jgi:hypothetical protein
MTLTFSSDALPEPPPPILMLIDEPHRASWESEFERRLAAYHEQRRRQSFLRRLVLRALSWVALAALRMETRLDI